MCSADDSVCVTGAASGSPRFEQNDDDSAFRVRLQAPRSSLLPAEWGPWLRSAAERVFEAVNWLVHTFGGSRSFQMKRPFSASFSQA